MMRLTEQQINYFNTFGFLRFPRLMADRIEKITSEFEAVFEAHGGGHNGQKHDGTKRSCIVPFIDQSEYLCTLLDDPRILGIASGLLGEDFNYLNGDGNFYVGDTNWHSDGWAPKSRPGIIRSIKVAFYLDPITRDTGCLRVIPGSFMCGDKFAEAVQEQIHQSEETWGIHGRDVPALALETVPGDVVCFNHLTKHAAFGGSQRRRMFTLNLSERYPDDRLDDLRGFISAHARFLPKNGRNYGDFMMQTAGPERMRHLEQIMANDGHLAEVVRKLREEEVEPARG